MISSEGAQGHLGWAWKPTVCPLCQHCVYLCVKAAVRFILEHGKKENQVTIT